MVKILIQAKGCKLISNKTDYKNTKGRITVEYICEHQEETSYNNF